METTTDPLPSRGVARFPDVLTAVSWPAEFGPVFRHAVTVDYSSLTASGAPITVPVTPYLSAGGRTIDVSTGVTYPAKAERARRNPNVALLFADRLAARSDRPPVVLVQGMASVRDADLQANTDRYIRSIVDRFHEAYAGRPSWMMRGLSFYLARIWIEITPIRVLWWPSRQLDVPPREWTAPAGTDAPPSDPAPRGAAPRRRVRHGPDWRAEADKASKFPLRAVTVVDPAGFPLTVPVRELEQTERGFRFLLAAGAEVPPAGAACLTVHTHDVPFTSQQNRTFMGRITRVDEWPELEVDRLLTPWDLPRNRYAAAISMLRKGRELRPRLAIECARRGQQPPRLRLPERV